MIIMMHLNALYYFANPHLSCQRLSNENGNGLIRRYFPKITDFRYVSEKGLQFVIHQINHLPKKIHGGKTSHELYYDINKKLISAKQINIITCSFYT